MTDNPAAGGVLTLRLENSLSSIEAGRLALIEHFAHARIDARVINRLEVVFEELVSNIVRHGGGSADVAIVIEAELRDNEIRLAVEDDGPAFNPFDRPEPAPYTDLATAQPGGLGIPLVRRLTRFAEYARIGTADRGANRVSLGISAG